MIAKQSIVSGRQANVIPLLSISSVRLKYLLANPIKYFTEEKKTYVCMLHVPSTQIQELRRSLHSMENLRFNCVI